MGDKNIAWLYKELPKLVAAGIISEKTAQQIKDYYGPLEEKNKEQNLVLIFSILGAVLIGSGLILLLAHNWSELTRLSRTLIIFTTLIGAQSLVAWVLLHKSYSLPWREGSTTALVFIVGAAIALIGQTYHLPSNLANFLLTWMLLILPLVYLADVTIPALFYLGGISWWSFVVQGEFSLLFWLLVVLIIPYYIKQIKIDKTSRKVSLLSWTLSLSFLLGIYSTLELNLYSSFLWRLIYLSYFSSLFLLGQKLNLQTKALEAIGLIGNFLIIYELGSFSETDHLLFKNLLTGDMLNYGITILLLGLNIYLLWDSYIKDRDNLLLGLSAGILLSSLLFSKILFLNLLIYNFYLLAISLSLLLKGLEEKIMKLANLGILMIAIQIIGRFFFLKLSFVWRGVVFVLVGISFLVSNIIMSQHLRE